MCPGCTIPSRDLHAFCRSLIVSLSVVALALPLLWVMREALSLPAALSTLEVKEHGRQLLAHLDQTAILLTTSDPLVMSCPISFHLIQLLVHIWLVGQGLDREPFIRESGHCRRTAPLSPKPLGLLLVIPPLMPFSMATCKAGWGRLAHWYISPRPAIIRLRTPHASLTPVLTVQN